MSTSRTMASAVLVVSWAETSKTRRIGRAPCQSWPRAASARCTDWWVSSQKACSQYGSRTTTTIRSLDDPPWRFRGGRPGTDCAGAAVSDFLTSGLPFFATGTAGPAGLPLLWYRPLRDGAGAGAALDLAVLAFSRSLAFFFMARVMARTRSSLRMDV